VKLSTKVGGPSRGPGKKLGSHGPPSPPLESPLGNWFVIRLIATYSEIDSVKFKDASFVVT